MFNTNVKRNLSLFLSIILMALTLTWPVHSAPLEACEDETTLYSSAHLSVDDSIIDNIPLESDDVAEVEERIPERFNEDVAVCVEDIIFMVSDEQILSTATLDDDFADDTVTVILTKEASKNRKSYTVADFRSIGAVEVKDLTRLSEREYGYVERVWTAQDCIDTMMKRDRANRSIKAGHVSSETRETIEQYRNIKQVAEKKTLVNVDEFRRILLIKLVEPGKEKVLQAISQLEQWEDIRYAGPSYIIEENPLENTIPNDPRLNNQWAINKVSLPESWNITTGSATINIGVIDTGIDGNHEDLKNRVNASLSRDFVSDGLSTNGLTDPQGHGTHVAGIIAAQGNNNIGIAGINWDVRLVSLRVCNQKGQFGPLGLEGVAAAINHARANDIPILSSSLTLGYNIESHQVVRDAVAGYNGLFVQSAGNEKINSNYLARFEGFPNVIVVAATDRNDNLSQFSNYGSTSIHLAAPGGVGNGGADDILSTFPATLCQNGTCGGTNNGHVENGYHYLYGTSMAAPHVAGVAALIMSADFSITTDELKESILNNVDEIPGLSGKVLTGGRLNAYKSLFSRRRYVGETFTSDMNGNEMIFKVLSYNPNDKSGTVQIGTGYYAERALTDASFYGNLKISDTIDYFGTSFTVKVIGEYAFSGYPRYYDMITSVEIPDTVTTIGEEAFSGQGTLESVVIGRGVFFIGSNAFSACTHLRSVTNRAETPQWIDSTVFSVDYRNVVLYVPQSSHYYYSTTSGWQLYRNIVGM